MHENKNFDWKEARYEAIWFDYIFKYFISDNYNLKSKFLGEHFMITTKLNFEKL
jgi:hypothetical protein